MREKFLEIPDIGQTYLIDILLFYYVPKVFVIENDNHKMFLLYEWTDDYSWFATQINETEYKMLLNREMSIQNAFIDKEAFVVRASDRDTCNTEKADSSILLNMLPLEPIYKED